MSSTSCLFACPVPVAAATDGRSARDVISDTTDLDDHVVAMSRNYAVPTNLAKLCAAPRWQGLYLLREESMLTGEALRGQHALLGQLLAEIEQSPSFVVEAMKEPYAPTGVLHVEGFEPRPYEMVYPEDAVVDGAFIYLYSEAKVLAMLAAAPCGKEACAAGDDDGESLESVFGLLKSQFALLGRAIEQGEAVAFAEMST